MCDNEMEDNMKIKITRFYQGLQRVCGLDSGIFIKFVDYQTWVRGHITKKLFFSPWIICISLFNSGLLLPYMCTKFEDRADYKYIAWISYTLYVHTLYLCMFYFLFFQVFSSAKYPAPDRLQDYSSIFTGATDPSSQSHPRHRIQNKLRPFDEKALQVRQFSKIFQSLT